VNGSSRIPEDPESVDNNRLPGLFSFKKAGFAREFFPHFVFFDQKTPPFLRPHIPSLFMRASFLLMKKAVKSWNLCTK
jgi:hypothetical protein